MVFFFQKFESESSEVPTHAPTVVVTAVRVTRGEYFEASALPPTSNATSILTRERGKCSLAPFFLWYYSLNTYDNRHLLPSLPPPFPSSPEGGREGGAAVEDGTHIGRLL